MYEKSKIHIILFNMYSKLCLPDHDVVYFNLKLK